MLVLNKYVKPIVLLTNKHLLKAFYVADMGLRQKGYRATKNLAPSLWKVHNVMSSFEVSLLGFAF